MLDAKLLVSVVFSGLAALVIEGVDAVGEAIVVQARTRGGAVKCPGCATPTTRLHAYAQRVPADVALDGRRVLLRVRIRGMCCDVADCSRRTFREQIPGVPERYQRRTVRLTEQIRATVRELAGRAAARVLPALGISAGRDTALRTLRGIPLPPVPVPRVLGIDDFALRRGQDYVTVLIDTHRRRQRQAGRCVARQGPRRSSPHDCVHILG